MEVVKNKKETVEQSENRQNRKKKGREELFEKKLIVDGVTYLTEKEVQEDVMMEEIVTKNRNDENKINPNMKKEDDMQQIVLSMSVLGVRESNSDGLLIVQDLTQLSLRPKDKLEENKGKKQIKHNTKKRQKKGSQRVVIIEKAYTDAISIKQRVANNRYQQQQRKQYINKDLEGESKGKKKRDEAKNNNKTKQIAKVCSTLLKVAEGIIKGKEATTISSNCKMASLYIQETEHDRSKVDQDEKFSLLKIGTHNINGLKLKDRKSFRNKKQLEEIVNEEWDKISIAIIQAANKNIPSIMVKGSDIQAKKAVPKLSIYAEIKVLYQIIKSFKEL
ncbi:10083_t:CDS:2, partial [Gigaspora margarita]